MLAKHDLKLDNGLEAELLAGPCGDSAALVVLVRTGLDHDPPGRSGMAQLAGRVLAAMKPDGRAERTVSTGSDYTLYSLVVPADKLLEELDDVAAWMSRTAPTETDLERERAELLAEIAELSGTDATATAMRLAEESMRPSRGEGKRKGIASEVEAITLEELQAFMRSHFAPGTSRVVISGKFDVDPTRARIEGAFSRLPAGSAPTLREATGATVRGTLVMGETPSAVAIAVPAPLPGDDLFGPFLVLAARLAAQPAEGKSWDTGYEPLMRPELLFVTGAVGQAEQPEPAAARIRAEVAEILAAPLTPEDLTRARERFALVVDADLLDPQVCAKDARAFASARALRAHLGLDGAKIAKSLDAASAEQLTEAAALFDTKHSAAVIAGGAIR